MKATERALYRGKRIDNGEWVEGQYYEGVVYPSSYRTHNIVVNGREVKVDPETVGQWTGLSDKNGTKIFEGDYLDDDYINSQIESDDPDYIREVYEVLFDQHEYSHGWILGDGRTLTYELAKRSIVSGNIHDK